MTKLELKSGKPQGQGGQGEDQQHQERDCTNGTSNDNDNKAKCFEDMLTALGLCVKRDGTTGSFIGFSCIGMDWAFILRVANVQALLSILSFGCLIGSMFLTGFNFYRFTSSAWAAYLLSCAYIGMRAGRWQSYPHAIAYCGMCTFQTLVYMSTMCWLFYSVYALNSLTHSYEYIRSAASDIALLFTLSEVLAIMSTVLTGIFGLIGCCRGFGRLLHAQEKMILDYHNVLAGAYGNAFHHQNV